MICTLLASSCTSKLVNSQCTMYNSNIFTARKRSLGQGNICLQVCVCPRGGGCLVPGGCLVRGVPGPGSPWSGGCLVRGVAWCRPPDGYCRWYASYWNAFLFGLCSLSGCAAESSCTRKVLT